MAKLNSQKQLADLQKQVAAHRKYLNTLHFRVEDLEAALDDARSMQARQRLARRKFQG